MSRNEVPSGPSTVLVSSEFRTFLITLVPDDGGRDSLRNVGHLFHMHKADRLTNLYGVRSS
jgi:hypothetical protein